MSMVNSPIRIKNYNSNINNTFIDSSMKDHISIESVVNGLADHGAQLLDKKNRELFRDYHNCKKRIRLRN
jgi:hypothetical protein